mgnify:CR=1 FL=1
MENKENYKVTPEEYELLKRIEKGNALAEELSDVIAPLSAYQRAEIIERALYPCPGEVTRLLTR